MAEYINRDRILSRINELQEICNTEVSDPKGLEIYNDVYDEIYVEAGNIEIDDVRPERHGKWIFDDDNEFSAYYHCDKCGAEISLCNEMYTEPTPNYCSNCGAKMDGKETTNE